MIIDFHIHAFPDNLAKKAINSLVSNVNNFGKTTNHIPCTDGTIRQAKEKLKSYADAGVLMPIATRSGQHKKVNDWAFAQMGNGILSFGSVFPFDTDCFDELYRIKSMGLKGIKLHPDYQYFDVDDKKLYPLYYEISKLGLPVLFHTGFDPVSINHTHCEPEALRRVAEDFSDMKIIAAHFGGNYMYSKALRHILTAGLNNIYVDISIAYFFAQPNQVLEGIKCIGLDKVLFATDLPWSEGDKTIKLIESLDLSEKEKQMIFAENAMKLLNITEDELC